MAYKVAAVPSVHDPAVVKYYVTTEPELVAIYDTEAEAKAHGQPKPEKVKVTVTPKHLKASLRKHK